MKQDEALNDIKDSYYYHVPRKPSYSTFLGCINAYDDYIRPMIITKMTTIEESLAAQNTRPQKYSWDNLKPPTLTPVCLINGLLKYLILRLKD